MNEKELFDCRKKIETEEFASEICIEIFKNCTYIKMCIYMICSEVFTYVCLSYELVGKWLPKSAVVGEMKWKTKIIKRIKDKLLFVGSV